jgi:phosphoribosyl 1,2-cyclic phosphate phosphodiesterase
MAIELHFLGTGTSVGVPMIGCHCAVCTSKDPHNVRRRSCLYVKTAKTAFVIDTPPDFRQQMLDAKIERIDAVVFTHAHADHIFGFDDIRRFNTLEGGVLPAYGAPETINRIRDIFDYIGQKPSPSGLYRPLIHFVPVTAPFEIGDVRLTPLDVVHGTGKMTGWLLECGPSRIGYISDCKEIPETTMALLRGLDVMVLDALRYRPHPTHLCVSESVALLQRIAARRSFLTHICHDLDHAALCAGLPPGISASYDGMALALP